VDVTIRCVCPDKADGSPRHESDTITLRDTLGFVATQTARNAVYLARGEAREAGDDLDPALVLALLTEQYLLLGVESWTLVDEKGKPVPVTRGAIKARLLEGEDLDDVATIVSDAADDLYASKVMLPLLREAARSSLPTPMASTSPTRGNGKARATRKRSSQSSTTTTQTAGTGTTSKPRVGDSNSSRNLVSVA